MSKTIPAQDALQLAKRSDEFGKMGKTKDN
jgi:hypothetical protein